MLITIGAFDGFHKGHAKLFTLCRQRSINQQWGVLTFEPPPGIVYRLFTLTEKELIRRILNIPQMYVLNFDVALMNLSPIDFWRLIHARFNVTGLVMGDDFYFGRNRSGNAESLKHLANSDGITNVYISPLLAKPKYSSSNIREFVSSGNVSMASELLGYPYFIMGRVIHGNSRGHTLNYPTANIALDPERVIPSYGVYSCAVLANGEIYCGALSIGNNPTFGDISTTRAEVHILDFNGDIYGAEIIIFLLERLRGIETFADKVALITQIGHDTEKCREIYLHALTETSAAKFITEAVKIYRSITVPAILNLTQRA